MKLTLRTGLSVLALLLLIQFADGQVPQFSPFSADLQITSSRQMGPSEVTGKVYAGSGHIRVDLDEMQGRQAAIITDFATRTTDILMLQQQMYIENKAGEGHGRLPGSDTADLHPYDPDNPCANQPNVTCKKIGVETVSGRSCDHWEITDKNGKVSNVWVDQKLHFPVKIVSPDTTLLLTNITEGEPNASLFKVPEGFHKLDIGAMPGMGGAPPQK